MKPTKIAPSSRSATKARTPRPPTPEQIEALAHAIWMDRGCLEGRDLDNWLEAERQLRGGSRGTTATDDIPSPDDALDPDRAVAGRADRELERIVSPPAPRSSTSL